MTVYAEKTGLVFQIVDDILDVTGDEAATGKKQGMDEELGKLTYPSLFGLEKSYVFAAEHTDEAAAALEKYGKCMDFLIKLALDLKKRIS
jgi:geranylgeranyl pyrophosphate synthase